MSNGDYSRRSVGAPFHDLGAQLDNPPPESEASRLHREQVAEERQRKVAITAAVERQQVQDEAGRIQG